MAVKFNGLNKWGKRGVALVSDIVMTTVALLTANWLSIDFNGYSNFDLAEIIILQSMIYLSCGLYRGVWRFASLPDLTRILRAVLIGLVTILIFTKIENLLFPPKMYVSYTLLLIILLSTPRFLYRSLNDYQAVKHGQRVLIVGSGNAGEGLIRDLKRSALALKYYPVGFVDDNIARLGSEIHGVRVLGDCQAIPKLVKQHKIQLIFIAIPSAGSIRMRQIVDYCEQANVAFRTLPSLKNITDGIVSINSLREISLEDLLGREQVTLNWAAIKTEIFQKTILVTGGGGSIGSELCKQISILAPENLVIVDSSEFNLYSIDLQLRNAFPNMTIHSHLCSTTDRAEMGKLFKLYRPHLVFHVAAFKHVPLLETHLRVAMFNNIIGTRVTAELAHQYAVKTFVLISTDKAVNPTNIMGATKRASEVFCQNYNLRSGTKYTTVRFGNVLESTGSVIPLFRKQLLAGGPLTVTHPEISRYFMTIAEASQLILQAVTMNQDGEIFVLDMGDPIKISYLAKQLIKLSGKIIGKDIEIQYVGLRPGEKLHEELFHKNENIYRTSHAKISRANVRTYEWIPLLEIMNEIELACEVNNEIRLRQLLHEIVPEFHDPLYKYIPREKSAYDLSFI